MLMMVATLSLPAFPTATSDCPGAIYLVPDINVLYQIGSLAQESSWLMKPVIRSQVPAFGIGTGTIICQTIGSQM